MPGDDDDAVLLTGKLRDDVVDPEVADWGPCREGVIINLVAFQLGVDVLLQFGMPRASHRTRADRDDLLHILHDVIAVDVRTLAGSGKVVQSRSLVRLRVGSISGCGLRRVRAGCCRRGLWLVAAEDSNVSQNA